MHNLAHNLLINFMLEIKQVFVQLLKILYCPGFEHFV